MGEIACGKQDEEVLSVKPAVDFDTAGGVPRGRNQSAGNVRRTLGEEGLAPVAESGVYVAGGDVERDSVGLRDTSCDGLRRGIGTELPPDFSGGGVQQEQSLEVGADKDKSVRDFKGPELR